jgi:uncharacterized protein YjdB
VAAVGGASTAVTWSSSAPAVATVSTSGVVTAVAAGNATVTATSVFDPTKEGSISIRVDAAAIVNSVSVTPGSLNLNVGASGQLTAAVSTGNNASQLVTWSTGNAATATVDQAGKVTAVAGGSTTIRATAQADASKFAEATVTVTAVSFPAVGEVVAGTDATFAPPLVEISLGGTVTWSFASLAHNVTFDAGQGAPANISTSTNTQVSRAFPNAGTFTYQCTLHGGMTGSVVVH